MTKKEINILAVLLNKRAIKAKGAGRAELTDFAIDLALHLQTLSPRFHPADFIAIVCKAK